ncbi:MAG TPA: hypothetical protein VKY74_12465 [Chloroflexia bacterium]|nr:hypothetical protein [Chloroflexia bacterium]
MLVHTLRWPRLALPLVLAAFVLAPLAGPGPAGAAPAPQANSPTAPIPNPHQAGVQWFAATGHTLRGTFQTYWTKYGGLAQFGYPITEEFTETDPASNKPVVVQYFERNRFEHHPENAGTLYEVLLGLLGRNFHPPDPPVPAAANPSSQYFDQTGHNVSRTFYIYWQNHGGLFVNGYPISEALQEVNPIDGKTYTVQYFERARYELHPENAGTPYEVLLGLLGTQLARQKGYLPVPPYPAMGHAADFSWVAGQVLFTRIQGGCDYVVYDASGTRFTPVGSAWDAALASGPAQNGANVILFGHKAGPGEPVPMCMAPGYIVDRVQANTNQ